MKSILYLLICLITVEGFLNKLPTELKGEIFKISKLENLISSKAIVSSIIDDMRSEINIERMFFQLNDANYLSCCLYFTIFSTFIFSQIQYFNNIDKTEKYMKMSKFKQIKKLAKRIGFVFLFVIFRDIDNAI